MRLARYRGLTAVAVWLFAPVAVQQDSTGQLQLVLGGGAGSYEEIVTSCEGQQVQSARIPFAGGGTSIEYHAEDRLTLTAFGGAVANDAPEGFEEWSGVYLGAQARLDWQYLGIGGGPVRWPDGEFLPNAYVRVGSREEFHARADLLSPSPPLGATGTARIGLGYNDGVRRALRLFGGFAPCNAACVEGSGGLFLEVGVPVSDRLDLEAGGLVGTAEQGSVDGALSARLRLHLGPDPGSDQQR